MNGRLDVHKQAGMTSHQVVHELRKRFGIRRIGHSGTLDPMAEGVLNVYLGPATRFIDLLKSDYKTYQAGFTLGMTSDTLDIWGNVEHTDYKEVTKTEIEQALLSFLGKSNQIPPMVSALKVQGKALYQYAREGIILERKARAIEILELRLLDFDGRQGQFLMRCSKGTYVRSLIDDLGKLLGQHALMHQLIRLENDFVPLHECRTLEELSEADVRLLDSHHPGARHEISPDQLRRMQQGQAVTLAVDCHDPRILLTLDGQFVGTAKRHHDTYIREKLL